MRSIGRRLGDNSRLITLIRKLNQKKHRHRERKFLLEGVRLIRDALTAGADIYRALYSPMLFQRPGGEELAQAISGMGIPIYELSDSLLEELCATESPQGIMAVVEMEGTHPREILDGGRVFVMACGVQDPGNLGVVIRTAAASGTDGVFLAPGTVDAYNPKVLRGSMGAFFRLPVVSLPLVNREEYAGLEGGLDFLRGVRDAGFRVVAADPGGERSPFESELASPFILLLGNEGRGLDAELLEQADLTVRLPLHRGVESLNVAVSAGVILYESLRQRSAGRSPRSLQGPAE